MGPPTIKIVKPKYTFTYTKKIVDSKGNEKSTTYYNG